jgi:putative transposase
MKRHARPDAIITDGLASYGAAMKDIGNEGRRQVARYLNHQAENSHLPFR